MDNTTRDHAHGSTDAHHALPDDVHSPDPQEDAQDRTLRTWPVMFLALPAFVAIWSGWVGLGEMTGFGPVQLLPGIMDTFTLNTAITLPIGMEVYAAYALYVWLSGRAKSHRTRIYAMVSALGGLILGAAGQIAYHLMRAAGITAAPWQVTVLVACLPVAVLGMGAALAHLVHAEAHADPVRSSVAQDLVHSDQVRTEPVHSQEPQDTAHDDVHTPSAQDPVQHRAHKSDPVRTVSMHRTVRTETRSTAAVHRTMRTDEAQARADNHDPVHTDPQEVRSTVHWPEIAEKVCSADPSGRRDPNAVASILQLRYDDGWPHARIAEYVECSTSTVSRTLAAARTLADL